MTTNQPPMLNRLRVAWWLLKLAVIVFYNPDYVDKMIVGTGVLRNTALKGKKIG